MELDQAIRRRRMARAFTAEPIDPPVLDRLVDLARRHPSAGNTRATEFLLLAGPAQTRRYWDLTLPAPRRSGFRWPGLLEAPLLVVVWVSADAYVSRYGEPDKATTGLGVGPSAWSVPYWYVDGGMAVQNLLLAAVDAGLGACFFGLFDHEPAVQAAFGVPAGWRAVGTVAVGHPAPGRPGRSAGRPRPSAEEVVHLGHW